MPASDVKVHAEEVRKLSTFEALIDNCTAEHESEWVRFRRACHQQPELSGKERQTSKLILERMRSLGMEAWIPERGVGVVGDVLLGDATAETPAIAIRADIDALQMSDSKTVEYASQVDEAAHTCGHDVHFSVVAGVAQILTELRQAPQAETPLSARFRFIFQAAEETCSGAAWMVEDGVLDNVYSILGIHVEPALLVNHIGIRYGVMTAQVEEIRIQVKGRGGHTARPHTTSDPIHATSMLISSLYQMLPRSVDVRDASVFSIGRIRGGSAPNVIPDEVQLAGTLRTIDSRVREDLLSRIQQTCEHVGDITGNDITARSIQPLGSVRNAVRETSAFESAARRVVGDENITIIDRPSMGGEDFAVYLDHCSGCQIRLGCATSLPWPSLHSPMFDVDERVIGTGARTVTRAALLLALLK